MSHTRTTRVPAQALLHELADALRMEWSKFVTLRSYLGTVAGLGLVLPVFAVIVSVTSSLQPDDTVLGGSLLAGAAVALVISISLGAVLITGEYRSGMLRVTLAACPQRWAVLAAKAGVVAAVVFGVGLSSAVAALGAGLVLLPDGAHATGDPFPALIGVAGVLALSAVLGVAIGAVVRDAALAVGGGVAVVLLPAIVTPMLGDHARWVGGSSLVGVLQKLTQSSDATHVRVGSLGSWPSLAVMLGFTFAALALAAWVLDRRDA